MPVSAVLRRAILFALTVALPGVVLAQLTDVHEVGHNGPAATATTAARRAQQEFEDFRRLTLPVQGERRGSSSGSCDEIIGRWCYWYDETEPPAPPEPAAIRDARERLIATLDSAARANPADAWLAGQRVRYLSEAGRDADALAAARACTATGWWCHALTGFALHMTGDYTGADGEFAAALALMPERDRCAWRDVSLLLDDASQQQYRRMSCADRAAYEDHVWFLARPLYSTAGNDARTEFYARVTMAHMLDGAAAPHAMGFDKDERELLLRYSWPRAWTRTQRAAGPNDSTPPIVGHEPTPAAPYIPPGTVLDNPVNGDSVKWREGARPIRGRYAPAYALPKMGVLSHQAAVFRRNDSAFVVLAYDATRDSAFGPDASAALVLTRGDSASTTVARGRGPRGTITARSTWGPLLLSAEVVAPAVHRAARARYGIRPPYSLGARVTVSDILLFQPYGELPQRLEDAIPHALPALRVHGDQKVGFFWETYGTDPAGEDLAVSLTVGRDDDAQAGGWRAKLPILRRNKAVKPVTVTVHDVSARGATVTPRALAVDLSSLPPGVYTVQLEVGVNGQYVVRAEREIEVVR